MPNKPLAPNRTRVLVAAVLILSLSGVASVGYIAVRLASTPDRVFFVGVVTAFLAPTLTAMLAILRGEVIAKGLDGMEHQLRRHARAKPRRQRPRSIAQGGKKQ